MPRIAFAVDDLVDWYILENNEWVPYTAIVRERSDNWDGAWVKVYLQDAMKEAGPRFFHAHGEPPWPWPKPL